MYLDSSKNYGKEGGSGKLGVSTSQNGMGRSWWTLDEQWMTDVNGVHIVSESSTGRLQVQPDNGLWNRRKMMLRWMCGVTWKDKITIRHIRKTAGVAQSSKNITEGRLNWFNRPSFNPPSMRRRAHTEESVEDGYTREKTERMTENKKERCKPTRFAKYWTEGGRGDGQDDVEKEDHE